MLNTQSVCGSCTQARGVLVTHEPPECSDADETVYDIRLGRVLADFANLQEDLRALITEAKAEHRVTERQVLDEILANVEQEARAAGLVGR